MRAAPTIRHGGVYALQRGLGEVGLVLVGLVVLVWTLLPIYHMLMLSVTPLSEAFAGRYWPLAPTLENFRMVVEQDHFFLQNFWIQLGN